MKQLEMFGKEERNHDKTPEKEEDQGCDQAAGNETKTLDKATRNP